MHFLRFSKFKMFKNTQFWLKKYMKSDSIVRKFHESYRSLEICTFCEVLFTQKSNLYLSKFTNFIRMTRFVEKWCNFSTKEMALINVFREMNEAELKQNSKFFIISNFNSLHNPFPSPAPRKPNQPHKITEFSSNSESSALCAVPRVHRQ